MTHNGFLNTYSFFEGGKKTTLVPLTPSELSKYKPKKNPERSNLLFACSKPFLKASHHEFQAFRKRILTTQEGFEFPWPSHPIAKSMLMRFSHIFLEEIPTGLPLKLDIQHHIDLMPESILPNKPAYQINSKDTE